MGIILIHVEENIPVMQMASGLVSRVAMWIGLLRLKIFSDKQVVNYRIESYSLVLNLKNGPMKLYNFNCF